MKVGFFDPKKGDMVEVEDAEFSSLFVSTTALQLSTMWQSGKHKMPSRIWCAWYGQDDFRIFMLDGSLPTQSIADRALDASARWPAY
jgi:hypothetical protein